MPELFQPRQSLFHSMDARVKIIFTLAFILALNLTPSGAWPAYVLFLAAMFSAILLSRLGVAIVLRRALLALPFVLSAVPLIFTGPLPRFALPIQGITLFYSPAGIDRFFSIAVKSWLSVQAAIVLTGATRFPDLLAGLAQLKLPRLFVAIIGLMWRYLAVIVDEVTRMIRARSSRSAALPGARRVGGSLGWRARVTGGMAGSLFLRSLERSDRVYAAMLSRGYNGEPPVMEHTPLNPADLKTLTLGSLALLLLFILGLLTGG